MTLYAPLVVVLPGYWMDPLLWSRGGGGWGREQEESIAAPPHFFPRPPEEAYVALVETKKRPPGVLGFRPVEALIFLTETISQILERTHDLHDFRIHLYFQAAVKLLSFFPLKPCFFQGSVSASFPRKASRTLLLNTGAA